MNTHLPEAPTLRGARLLLRPFTPDLISERYLGWLADPVVNRYSRRLGQPAPTRAEAAAYLGSLQSGEAVLAMECGEHGHIGNIKYGPIDQERGTADISILLGETAAWGKGYGTEAVYLVSRWLFDAAGVARVEAGSANPAFLSIVAKLGWQVMGQRSEPVQIQGRNFDWTLVALAKSRFVRRPELEPPARTT